MSGKKSGPMIEKLTSSWVSGNTDVATSPRSPLDLKIQSPRGLKNYDLGGVGLGIVAALEKSGDSGGEIQANKFLCSRNLSRSDPIPVNFPKNFARRRVVWEEMETIDDSLEDYTYVKCHGPDESYTRVYWDGGKYGRSTRNKNVSVFHISPARFADDSSYAYPTSDFLSSCHLCRKNLHGKDIYMYRGEKAFCSTECRYRQIVIDERKEQQCSSQASRSADVSKSPYTNENIFSTGILAS